MAPSTVFMFSGQGSQYYGMGRDLYESHSEFARSLHESDAIFAEAGLPGVLAEMHRSDRTATDQFDSLRYTHPAILMVELALVDTLRDEGLVPDYVLGASLGEFAAAAAAGAVSRRDLAFSIAEQVRLVESLCPPGGMIAILGDVAEYERDSELRQFELAAINFDRHFVLTGGPEELDELDRILRRRGVPHQRLPVAYAFHSWRMDVAAEPYRRALTSLPLHEPAVPLASCATASVMDRLSVDHFWQMVRSPILFRETVRTLEEHVGGPVRYVDVSPSATMANFAVQNLPKGSRSSTVPVLDPFAPSDRGLAKLRDELSSRRRTTTTHHQGVEMKALVFPGQGSQTRGMGGNLFEEFPEYVALADEVLGYSVAELCLEDPHKLLHETQYTQPALYVVNALTYYRWRQDHGDVVPAYVAGHSLGEYNALLAAGAFDFSTGLRLVKKRGELMAAMAEGGMAAVIGLSEQDVRRVLAEQRVDTLDVANHNAPDQLIVSGLRDDIAAVQEAFTAAGARYVPLRVSGAFHSRYMAPAKEEFERYLASFSFADLQVPVVANVTGQPYRRGEIVRTLADQLVEPVRWQGCVRYLLAQGVTDIEEVGPGSVLSKLVTAIRRHPADSDSTDSDSVPRADSSESDASSHAVEVSAAQAGAVDAVPTATIRAQTLGRASFREEYGTKYAYVCGSMYRGIASEEMVIRAGKAGVLSFFGTGGLELDRIDAAAERLSGILGERGLFGMNLVHNPTFPDVEERTIEILLRWGVRNLEASAFMKVSRALVYYRVAGLSPGADGSAVAHHRIIAKVSRPEVAEAFLSPPPEPLVRELLSEGLVTAEQARLAAGVPVADDLCVEADSGGHTDRGEQLVLLPTIVRLRDRLCEQYAYTRAVRVGAAGGIGTPEAAAAAFVLGADFILTGSVNLCTVESGMSPMVKDMLDQINVQDTDYAPAGDMFEFGAQVQVLKRGVFFPARARKLYELYRRHESLEELDADTRSLLEQRYFRRSLDDVWSETREYFAQKNPRELEQAEQNPKHKMALVFRWYFGYSQRAAFEGIEDRRLDFQIHCGSALGAFNQWVKGTAIESWRDRHVDEIAERLMTATAQHLEHRLAGIAQE